MENIPILYEDDNILVIDKPSSVVVHPYDHSSEKTLLDFLRVHSPFMFSLNNLIKLQDGRTIPLGGIVHKLDRGTSGVMVIAKTQLVFDVLSKEFKEHEVKKEYVALVEGIVEKDSITINAPLGRDKKDYRQSVNPKRPRGPLREAITEVSVIKRLESKTLVRLYPKTGRTHQLRAHLASIGHPIVGDIVYGSTSASPRIMLHAEKISFSLRDKEYSFTSPSPF